MRGGERSRKRQRKSGLEALLSQRVETRARTSQVGESRRWRISASRFSSPSTDATGHGPCLCVSDSMFRKWAKARLIPQ
nr:unnamed protein product [Digitaria exilis]